MSDPVRVHVRTLGCKVNRVESETILADLLGSGAVWAAEDEADVVIVNTCTVTGEADAKARKAVRQALGTATRPLVVVTGCMAALDRTALEALDPRVVVEPDKQSVASAVRTQLGLEAGPSVVRAGAAFRTRAMLKVQDGCDAYCSYCIVPYARGAPNSVAARDLADDARRLVAAGVKEIVLTGINLGRYDDGGADLAELVVAIAGTGVPRLRLSSIEPMHLDERLLATLSRTPGVCPHFHVPLQSGSDDILLAMGRGYSVADYESRISDLRSAVPGAAVTTDVIVGFPGETDLDAEKTVETCERIGFSKLHVFRYSARKGTPAAGMAGQVPAALRAERSAVLRATGSRLRQAFVSLKVGSRETVLVEKVSAEGAEGTTADYVGVTVETPLQGCRAGDLLDVNITRAEGDVLLGVPE